MQPNQQFNPFQNPDPNQQVTPLANDPWTMPSQQPTAQPGYQQPQAGVSSPYNPAQPQMAQPNPFMQPTPAASPQQPAQQWNPETSMFEPVQPARPSEWEQQFVAETVAAATAPPAPKKSHVGRTIAIIAGILLLLGGAAAAYVYAQQQETQPQAAAVSVDTKALFYDAIENHMNTDYIGQLYDVEQTHATMGHTVAHAESVSDFSDPAKPKSRIIYSIKSHDEPSMDTAGEIIDLQEGNYYAMLAATETKSQNKTATASGVMMDTWYQVPQNDFASSAVLFDTGGLRPAINTTSGQVLVGKYSDDARQKLMKLIDDRQVYTIKKTEAVSVESAKMTKYTVTIKGDALKSLNDQALALLELSTDEKKDFTNETGDDVPYEFLIDNNEKRLTKVSAERPSNDKKSKDKVTITFSYPKTVVEDLKKPSTVKALPAATPAS